MHATCACIALASKEMHNGCVKVAGDAPHTDASRAAHKYCLQVQHNTCVGQRTGAWHYKPPLLPAVQTYTPCRSQTHPMLLQFKATAQADIQFRLLLLLLLRTAGVSWASAKGLTNPGTDSAHQKKRTLPLKHTGVRACMCWYTVASSNHHGHTRTQQTMRPRFLPTCATHAAAHACLCKKKEKRVGEQ